MGRIASCNDGEMMLMARLAWIAVRAAGDSGQSRDDILPKA